MISMGLLPWRCMSEFLCVCMFEYKCVLRIIKTIANSNLKTLHNLWTYDIYTGANINTKFGLDFAIFKCNNFTEFDLKRKNQLNSDYLHFDVATNICYPIQNFVELIVETIIPHIRFRVIRWSRACLTFEWPEKRQKNIKLS